MISHQRAFSLIEFSIVLGMMTILASSIIPIAIRSYEIKACEKTVQEIKTIQLGAQNYYNDHLSWPNDLNELKVQGYLNPLWVANNPWHNAYEISNTETSLIVTTQLPLNILSMAASRLPSSIVQEDRVMSTVLVPSGENGIPVGVMMPLTTNAVPYGWLLCNGQSVSRTSYHRLFDIIGTAFGAGDGTTTFNLPDMRGRTIIGLDNMGGVQANIITGWNEANILGGRLGEEKHHLTISEMPSHHFDIMINDATGSGGASRYPETVHVTSLKAYSTNTLGNDQPHNVVQPSMALNWIIKS